MTRAALLARVSRGTQAGELRHSLPNQLRMLREMAERRGWDVVREFEIPGESAFTDELAARPLFLAAVEAAERREFDVLLVSEFSRFSRSLRVAFDVIYRLKQAGVTLLDEHGTDYTEDEDRAVFDAWGARRSSRDHGKRVANGHAGQFARGLPVGDIPFGYRRVYVDIGERREPNTNVPPEVVPEEADAIRWAYRTFATRGSYLEIAREFTARGLRPRSKARRLAPGITRPPLERFGESSVQRILENPFYAGYVSLHGEQRRGQHEAIVGEEMWQAVQSRKRWASRAPRSVAMLSGLAVCASCGTPLHNQASPLARYYRERRRDGACPAAGRGWQEGDIHQQIDELMRGLGREDAVQRYVEIERRAMRGGEDDASSRTRAALQAQRRRLGHALVTGSIDEAEHDALLADITRQLAALPIRVDEGTVVAGERLRRWSQVWEVANEAERRVALRTVFSRVELDLVGKEMWVAPWEEYDPLFALRRAVVGGYTPGRSRTQLSQRAGLYLPSELVA